MFHNAFIIRLKWSLILSLVVVGCKTSLAQNATTQSTITMPAYLAGGSTPPGAVIYGRKVTIPPLIILQPLKDLAFRELESIELPCVASGSPPPVYRWQMNEKDFDPSGNDGRIAIQPGVGTLIFARPLARDEAIYQCFATNIVGTALTVKINLRQAILQPFQTMGIRYNYPTLGSSLQLRCTPPTSYPQANIFWATISDGMSFTVVDLSDRVTIDPIGNLNFVNIVADDFKNNNTYTCVAQNMAMRSIQQGEYNRIIPSGVNVVYYPPAIMWQTPTQQVAVRDATVTIKCIFSGNPTPRVDWTRSDAPLSGRVRFDSFGQQLTITGVQYGDAGNYECQGINDEGMVPIRRSFQLNVESAPYWIIKPQSVDAAEGESATFTCVGDGIPVPNYFWFLNGVPITKVASDPRRSATEKTLSFMNMTTKDAQVVQCNVTNKYGYNWTNAYLNVLTEPPFILDPPLDYQKAAEGQSINLTCKVYGSPKPLVVWKKGYEQLTGGRYQVMDDGDLQIVDVSLVDAGTYTCTATSRLGYTEATGSLIVRRKTMIVTAPEDMMVYEGTEAKFTCTATTDPEEVQNLQILWQKDGQTIDYALAQRVFQNQMDNSLTISGTIYLDTGVFTCLATNGLDSSQASAQLIVQAVPDPPSSVQVRCFNLNRQAEIWWQPGKENYAPILNFIVQYNTSFAPDTWYDIVTNLSQNDRRIVVSLSPWGNYTFRVIARNKIGLSLPSMQTFNICTTQPDVPDKNPQNVIGEGDQPGNLVIFWTPMPPIEQNGPDFKYIVTWQQINASNAQMTTAIIQRADAWLYVVPDPQPIYVPYLITVKCNNAKGDSTANLYSIIGWSGESTPLVTPTDMTYVPSTLTPTSVNLTWTNIDLSTSQVRGFFRGYRCEYGVDDANWQTNLRTQDFIINEPTQYPRPRIMKRQASSETSTNMYSITVQNIPPNSPIRAQVRVLTKYYAGPPSNQVTFNTPEGDPGPPANIFIAVVGATHFIITWAPPNEPNGNLISYNISYQTITSLNLGRMQIRQDNLTGNASQSMVTGLNPNTTYRIYLAASTINGLGESIFIDAMTSLSGPPDPPTFAIIDLNDTSAVVSWQPSRQGIPGSVFYIQYRARGYYDWLKSADEYMFNSMALLNLEPGTVYQVRVVAKNGDGFEAAAVWLEFRTYGVAPGDFYLATTGWFYGIWIALFLIVIGLILLMFLKKYTDRSWEKKEEEIDEQLRQLQAEEAARGLGVFNNYAADTGSREYLGPDRMPLYGNEGYGTDEYDHDYYPEKPGYGGDESTPGKYFDAPPSNIEKKQSISTTDTFV